jgi:urease alpha subunit
MRYFTLKTINPVIFCGIIHELGVHSIVDLVFWNLKNL